MTYHAMTKYLDDNVGRLVALYREKSMWDNTLLWFASDNGGPIYVGGNNYPMRGVSLLTSGLVGGGLEGQGSIARAWRPRSHAPVVLSPHHPAPSPSPRHLNF